MKDKRTYTKLKEHGEDMSHENESKTNLSEDRDPGDLTLLTEQYRLDLKQYQDRESEYIRMNNVLEGTKRIVIDMSKTIKELTNHNKTLSEEIDRLNKYLEVLKKEKQ